MLNIQAKRNDTFFAMPFELNERNGEVLTPINISDATIKMQLRKSPCSEAVLTLGNGEGLQGISITDVNRFEIDEQVFSIGAGIYDYDIQITFEDGVVQTWISGKFTIINDITR